MTTRHFHWAILIAIVTLLPISIQANPNGPPSNTPSTASNKGKTIFQVLNRPDVLDITIETNLAELIDNRRRLEYQKAVLSYETEQGENTTTIEI